MGWREWEGRGWVGTERTGWEWEWEMETEGNNFRLASARAFYATYYFFLVLFLST